MRSTCYSSHASVPKTAHKAPFTEEKSVKSPEIYPLDKVAWVLPDEINAMKNCTHCNRDLPQCRVRSTCFLSHASIRLTSHKAPFVVEKSVMSPEMYPLEPEA